MLLVFSQYSSVEQGDSFWGGGSGLKTQTLISQQLILLRILQRRKSLRRLLKAELELISQTKEVKEIARAHMHQTEWCILETASTQYEWNTDEAVARGNLKEKLGTLNAIQKCLNIFPELLRSGIVGFISRNNFSHLSKRWIIFITPYSSGKTPASHCTMNQVLKPSTFLRCF